MARRRLTRNQWLALLFIAGTALVVYAWQSQMWWLAGVGAAVGVFAWLAILQPRRGRPRPPRRRSK